MLKRVLTLILLAVVLLAATQAYNFFGAKVVMGDEPEIDESLDYGRPIQAMVVSNSDKMGSRANKIIDNSGMLGSDGKLHPHNNIVLNMWQSEEIKDSDSEVTLDFEFDSVYSLGEMHIWNYNEPDATGRGLKNIKIFYSADGENYTELKGKGYPYQLAQADGSERLQATNLNNKNSTPVYFYGVPARFVRITAKTKPTDGNWGGKDGKEAVFGLSEVKFYDYREKTRYSSMLASEAFPADDSIEDKSIINLVNSYGMTGPTSTTDTHSNNPATMWHVERGAGKDGSIAFDLNGTYPIKEMHIWNYNDPENLQWGMRNITVYHSLNGKSWTELKGVGYPYELTKADGSEDLKATNLNDGKNSPINFGNIRARYIKITPKAKAGDGNWDEGNSNKVIYGLSEVRIYCGEGIVTEPAPEWTALFSSYEGYSGSDGIFSIPLSGIDMPGHLGEDGKTLFTFGDTFIGNVVATTRKRANYKMVNFTSGILSGNKPDPNKIVWQYEGARSAIEFEDEDTKDQSTPKIYYPDVPSLKDTAVYAGNSSGMSGYSAKTDTHDNNANGATMWTSAENPGEKGWIMFDLGAEYPLSEMWIWNYNMYDSSSPGTPYVNRGLRDVGITYSSDGENWTELKGEGYPYRFAKADGSRQLTATNLDDGNNSPVDLTGISARYIKITPDSKAGVGNWGGITGDEAVFGLSEARFYKDNGEPLYYTVATSGSTQPVNMPNNWHWIGDGVVVDGYWYAFTTHLISDPTGPAGFQFKVIGTNMVKAPVTKDGVDFSKSVQFDTPLDRPYKSGPKHENINFARGIFANTEEAGAPNPDGYIYIYGNESVMFGSMTVARVRPDDIENFNEYRFWTGSEWSADITKAKGVLPGASPELSVTPITWGQFKGKYLAVFQMIGISEETCYAVGDTPYGPFSKSEKLHITEKDPLAYHYNAKAHPHLSKDGELLISYNKNTASGGMETHTQYADLYRPRFLVMKETSASDEILIPDDTLDETGSEERSSGSLQEEGPDRTIGIIIFLSAFVVMVGGTLLINKFFRN